MADNISAIFMRFPEGRSKALTFSYDDGMKGDKKLVSILNKHGLKGTFNISSGLYSAEDSIPKEGNIYYRLPKSQITELFANGEHEVAVHSLSHSHLETLPSSAIVHEILHDRENLEKQFGKIIRGMAYPMGTFDDKVVETVRNCGIAYARTVISTEKFDLPTDWLRLPATCHHRNPRLMELAKEFVEKKVKFHSQLFYLWGHTYEFYEKDNWNVIEEFTEFMAGREKEIWYATNIEIYEYIEDFNKLIFSADCSMVKNPTSRTLWFESNKQMISIAPGEAKNLR